MNFAELDAETLWVYYQRGYFTMIQSGRYFRQALRASLSHVFFQRAMPLLVEYYRADRGKGDFPPGFSDQMEACPLTARDLLHIDYAISLGYVEVGSDSGRGVFATPVLDWPGPGGHGVFVAADAVSPESELEFDLEGVMLEEDEDEGTDENEEPPPFDL